MRREGGKRNIERQREPETRGKEEESGKVLLKHGQLGGSKARVSDELIKTELWPCIAYAGGRGTLVYQNQTLRIVWLVSPEI